MLLADKYDLQEQLKLSLLQIEDKELNFFTQNCYTVGTQAALIAGFVFSAIVEALLGALGRLPGPAARVGGARRPKI